MAGTTAHGRDDRWHVLSGAFGLVLLLDVLRVWQPSVIFIYGRAGSTPATQLGAFAAAWVLVAVLGAATVRLLGPARLTLVGAVLLAACRLGLSLTDGGDAQLYVASVGWVAAVAWLSGLVAGPTPRPVVARALMAGLIADAAIRGALHSVDTVWLDGVSGLAVSLALVTAFVVSTVASRATVAPADATAAAAWPWLTLGPLVALYGVLAGTPARVAIAADVAPGLAAALVVASLGAGLAWTASGPWLPPRRSATAAAVVVLVGTVLAALTSGLAAVTGQVLLAVGTGGVLAAVAAPVGAATPTRRSLVTAGALALLFVWGFLYYAAYDISFGIPNRAFLVAAAVAVAGLTLAAGARATVASITAPPPGVRRGPVAVAVALTLLAGTGAWAGSGVDGNVADGAPSDGSVRVMVYNLHMGYDTAGRFDTTALADVVLAEEPDIVVLNEVDRGWFLNGSHDVLQLLAEEVGFPFVFAPAADEVWGNAILSRFPLADPESVTLPAGGVPMARSVISAVAELPDGTELVVVGTHLHHVRGADGDVVRRDQATVVAAHVRDRAGDGRPAVVMGDMNTQPGTAALAPFETIGLTDVVAPLGPALTFPSWAPDEQIDHIFATPDLAPSMLSVPASQASDHLGVAVTLTPR